MAKAGAKKQKEEAVNHQQDARLYKRLVDELGPTIIGLLEDPDVTEVMLNPDGRVWVQKANGDTRAITEIGEEAAMSQLAVIATILEQPLNDETPGIDGILRLPGEPRISASIPPLVESPQYCMRVRRETVLTLNDLVENGTVTDGQARQLREHITEKRTIVIVGGTSSGKTTLLNALISEIAKVAPQDRVIALEDAPELIVRSTNAVMFKTDTRTSMDDLVRRALRNNPDRIIVGEVRGGEALSMLDAWTTGHPGMATYHARTDRGIEVPLLRLEQMARKADPGSRHLELIEQAVDVVVTIGRSQNGERKVEGIFNIGDGKR